MSALLSSREYFFNAMNGGNFDHVVYLDYPRETCFNREEESIRNNTEKFKNRLLESRRPLLGISAPFHMRGHDYQVLRLGSILHGRALNNV
jgi:hypothetical protein